MFTKLAKAVGGFISMALIVGAITAIASPASANCNCNGSSDCNCEECGCN